MSSKASNKNSSQRRLCQQPNRQADLGPGDGPPKKKGENRLLYKIKYINPTVSGNNLSPAKKKKTANTRDQKGATASSSSARQRPPIAGTKGKVMNGTHDASQYREDGHHGSRQPVKMPEESQNQRRPPEVFPSGNENTKAPQQTTQHGQAELVGWGRTFNGAME